MHTNLPHLIAAGTSTAAKLPRLHRRTSLALALAAIFGTGASSVQAQNQIIPTEKTATQLQVNGSVTNITTGTIKGVTGFNSFSRFEVDRNNTVNLILPGATQNLVNLVTDRAIEINGVVNSLRDGRIGGNVIFADPNGMLVGGSGVLNVGSLSVLTPTRGFVDGVIGIDGTVSDLAAGSLLRGDAERSSGGLIRIDGQVNALEQIRLNAAQINIGGTLAAGADVVHRAAFSDAVNAGGLQPSSGLIDRGGAIELVAGGALQISGSLDVARREGGGSGGTLTVMADKIELTANARLDAAGTSGGGQIQVGVMAGAGGAAQHANSTVVNQGVSLTADAIEAGDGGQILVWGDHGNNFAGQATARGGRDSGNGGMVEVSSVTGLRITGAVDTSAAKGTAGSLLIDPENVEIIDGAASATTDNVVTVGWLQSRVNQNTTVAASAILTVGGATGTSTNLDLTNTLTQNTSTLTLSGSEVVLNTGSNISTSGGNVQLNGSKITLNAGSTINTGVNVTGSSVGNITATALSEDISTVMGNRNADASILANGTLNGHVITLSATAKAETTNPDLFIDSSVVDAKDRATGLLGFKWVEGVSSGTASVTIGSTASLTAVDKIDISATGSQVSKLDVKLGDSANPLFNTVAVHGTVEGGASALVESGAKLTAGGDLSVKATNSSVLDVQAKVFSYNENIGVSFAYGESDVKTSAIVQKGADLKITGGIDVIGLSEASYSVQASSSAWGTGKAGIAAAIGDLSNSSVAELNADATTAGGNVRVQAENLTLKNFTKASTETGSGIAAKYLPNSVMQALAGGSDVLTSASSIITNKLAASTKSANKASGGSTDPSTTTLKIGSALSLVNANFSAHASIGPSAKVESTGGDVVVYANVEDHVVHNIAQSAVSSATTTADGTAADPAAQYSASAGVAMAFLKHDAQALIGQRADITGQAIVVDSNVAQPLDITWAQWDGFSAITNKLSPKLGLPEEVLTSYANASADATGAALAGSVNWFDVANTSRAWVDQSAQLTAKGSSGARTVALDDGPSSSPSRSLTVAQPISIAAHSHVETIDVAGNLSAKMISGTGGGADTTAVGGAFVGVNYANKTRAGVDDGVSLTATSGGISILADSDDKAYVIAPSTGEGSSISGNGAGAYTHINNETQAALSNRAIVTSGSLDIAAQESMEVWTVAGAFNSSSGTSVGASIALNDLKTTTAALIGDVSALRASSTQVNLTGAGKLTLDSLSVKAETQGQAGALSIAAARAKSEPAPPKSADDAAQTSETKAQTATQPITDSSASKLAEADAKVSEITQPLREAQDLAKKADPQPDQPTLNLSAAGSASVNNSHITASATIDAATDATVATLALTASNNTNLIAVSGGAALTMAGAPSVERSGALAGAVAIDLETGNTLAGTTGSTFKGIESVDINAWTSGQHVAVGLGLASNSETKDSTTLVGSVSLAQVRNTTEAFASQSEFTAKANTPNTSRGIKVLAYDGTLLGIGGGALAIGGSTAVGVAMSLGDVSNAVSAHLDDTTINSGFDSLTVAALSPTTIVATALEVAGTTGKTAAGASTAVALVRNHTNASINDSEVTADKTLVVATDSPSKEGLSDLLTQADVALSGSPQNGGQNVVDFSDTGLLNETPDGASIIAIAGSVQAGKSAFGASVTYNDVQNETTAQLSGTVDGSVDVRAADHTSVIGVALGVAVGSSGNAAGVGSATVNLVHNTTLALIGNDDVSAATTQVTASNSSGDPIDLVAVTATSATSVWSVAGSASKSKSGNSGGAAIAYNTSDSDTQANVVNAAITATSGGVKVDAQHEASLHTIAAAVSQSDEANAVGGSYAQNVIKDSLDATVSGSTISAKSLTVKAGDADGTNASIQALSGGAALALKGNSAGVGISVNEVGLKQSAQVNDSSLTVDKVVNIEATTNTQISAMALGVSVSKQAGIGLSSTANTIANKTSAELTASSLAGSSVKLTIKAQDSSAIESLAGAYGSGETAGAGAAIAVNRIANEVNATLAGGQHVVGTADTVRVQNAWIEALSNETTHSIAVGLGGAAGGTTGLAGGGSVAVNQSGSKTRAAIDANADVDAANNVGVIASNTNEVAALAGGAGLSLTAAGVGMSTSVNLLSDETSATVGGNDDAGQSATSVIARGADANDTMSINTGELQNTVSLLSSLTASATFKPAALKEKTFEKNGLGMNGLAVNATSLQTLSSAAVSVGAGKDGAAALTTVTNHIGGSTTAEITGAQINQVAGALALVGKDVDVKASTHAASSSLVGAVALSAGASGGIAIDTEVMSGSTTARVTDSDVNAAGLLGIHAQSSATIGALAGGVAIGSDAGGAGTGLVAELSGNTVAALIGGEADVGSLAIHANSQQSVNLIGGSIGGGASVGLGAVFSVVDSRQTTQAYIGDAYAPTNALGVAQAYTPKDTEVTSLGDVGVEATTGMNNALYIASAGVSGSVGIGLTAGVLLNENKTEAQVAYVGQTGSTGLSAGGKLSVNAAETDLNLQGAGALGFGASAAGIGATVAVTVAKAQVLAQIRDSQVESASLKLSADNDQALSSTAISVGAGAYVGVGATVSLIQLGSGDAAVPDGLTGSGGVLGSVNALTSRNNTGDAGGTLSTAELAALDQSTRVNLDTEGALTAGNRNSAVAHIASSTVTTTDAVGDLEVLASATTNITNNASSAGVGGVGLGGSVTVSSVYNNVEAGTDSQSTLVAAGNLKVSASNENGSSSDGITSTAIAGGGGVVGLGAAVGLATLNNQVLADVGGHVTASGNATVLATDSSSIDAQAVSVAAGFVGGGLTYVDATKTGSVQATFNPASATGVAQAGGMVALGSDGLKIEASSSGRVNAKAQVGTGGIGAALGGNHAAATDSVNITADIGAGAAVAAKTISVLATRTPQVKADTSSFGVAGGVQVGVSESDAQITGKTLAKVGDGVVFGLLMASNGDVLPSSLAVKAQTLKPDGAESADASAFAAGGGALAGINGALAFATNNSDTEALVGNNVTLPYGDVAISALADSSQLAKASGISVSGVLGVGADYAQASSNRTTRAALGSGAHALLFIGDLTIQADGTDDNQAYSEAGAGGILAGAAAIAATSTKGSTTAEIVGANVAGPTLWAGDVSLSAKHASQFFSQSDAVQGSLAGGSGASSTGAVDYTVAADIGKNASLNATDIRIEALNATVESDLGDNAKGASGGAVAGAGMSSVNDITTHTRANIGDDASLVVSGNPLSSTHGDLVVVVGNTVVATDSASVNAGGAFAGLTAKSITRVNSVNSITVGERSVLSSVGNLDLGTYSTANIKNDSYAHGYGLAGGAGGNSTSDINVDQKVNINADAKLDSWGNLSLATGKADGGSKSNVLQAKATNQVYFDGAFNGTDPHGEANIHNNGTVTVADGVTLDSVRDIALAGVAGVTSAAASGSGHYTILGIPVSNSSQSTSNDGQQSLSFNGTAVAGTRHEVSLDVDAYGNITDQKNLVDAVDKIADYKPVQNLIDQVNRLGVLKASSSSTSEQADAQAQIDTLNALIQTLNGRGLNASTQISAIEVKDTMAAGGNIDITADQIEGSGSMTAWGGPTISLHNASADFLVVDQLFIPNELGGNIRLRGTGQAPVGLITTENNKDGAASIDIRNTFDTSVPGQAPVTAPAIFLTNSIESAGGSLSIFNQSGDLGQFGAVSVSSLDVQVPNGAFIVNSPTAGYFLTGDPQATYGAAGAILDTSTKFLGNLWNASNGSTVFLPGGSNPLGNRSSLTSDGGGGHGTVGSADEAITLVANYFAQHQSDYTSADSASNEALGMFLAGSPGNYCGGSFFCFGYDGPTNGTGYMFMYPGNGYYAGSSDSYKETYGSDTSYYVNRYALPAIGVRKLVNTVTTLPEAATTSTIVVGTNAIINAKYIDINGSIKAGLAHDFSATISDVIGTSSNGIPAGKNFIDCINDAVCRPSVSSFLTANGLYKYPTSGIAVASGATAVDVYYDPSIKQLVLQNISGGGAGSVSLRGQIINTNNSTSSGSSIEVATGFAKVDIVNNTGAILQTGDINTGNGNVGVIKITDTLKHDSQGNALTTWYVNRLGQGTSQYQSHTATDYAGLTTSVSNGQYAPAEGARYQWQYDADLSRTFTVTGGDWPSATTTAWTWTELKSNTADSLGDVWKITKGVITDASLVDTAFQQSFTGSATSNVYSVNYTYGGDWKWNWDVMTSAHIASTVSLKADYGIKIGFDGGREAGEVSVASAQSSILLGGNIQNINGLTSLTANGVGATVSANANGVINTQSLAIQADSSIGALNDPLKVTLTNPLVAAAGLNKVSAISHSGDIGLALSGADAILSDIRTNASGDVLVHANGSMLGDAALPVALPVAVTGRNITLLSDNGSIGSIAAPLIIQTLASTNAQTGAITGGVLNADALGDIGIWQNAGDLYLDHVTTVGDVKLVAAGNLLDGRTAQRSDNSAELAAVWDKMSLHASSNDLTAITAFENTVNGNYASYWALMGHGAVVNGGFVLDADGIKALQAQADQSLQAQAGQSYAPGMSSALPLVSATAQQVMDYAQARYLALSSAIVAANGGSSSSLAGTSQDYFSAIVARTYKPFTASSDQVDALTRGQYWTDDALLYQINASALQPASSAVTAVSDINIKGRRVELVSTGAGIGKLGDAVSFDLSSGGLSGASLSVEQKAALASANSAGDLINLKYAGSNGQDPNACSAAIADCKLVSFDIKPTSPVFVNVGQAFSGSAATDAYIQAQGSLPLAGFSAGQNLTIVSESGMSNAAASGVTAVKASTLNLQNGSGSIGSAAAALTLEVSGPLQAARSGNAQGGDIHLDVVKGNLSFLDLFAANTLSIKTSDTAPGMGNVFSTHAIGGAPAVSLAAQNLALDTTGSVYQEVNGVRTQLIARLGSDAAPGEVLGTVGQDLDLFNENAFTVGTLAVGGNASLSTDSADITVDALSAGNVDLSSASGKILGLQRSTGSAENVYSTGTVTLNGGTQHAQTNTNGGGIGQDSDHRLVVSAQNLDATTGAGDIFIGLANNQFTDRTASIVGKAGTAIDLSSSVDFIASKVASATGSNSATSSDTGSDIRLSSTGTAKMRLADVSAGRDLLLNSGDGAFVIEPNARIAAARDIVLTMTGNGTMTDATANSTSTSSISAGRNIGMNAAAISLHALTAAGGIDLTARTGDIDYTNLNAIGGSLSATAKGKITGNAGGQLNAGGDATLSANAVALADVKAGQDLVITLDGGDFSTLAGSKVAAARDLRITLGGSAVLDDSRASGLTTGRDAFLEASALRLDNFTTGRDLNLIAKAGDIHYANLNAGGNLQATVRGALIGDASSLLQADGNASVVADSASFDRVTVGGTADLTSLVGGLTGSGLLQASTLTANAHTSAQLNAVKTSGTALDQITAAQVSIASLDTAQSVAIRSAGDIALGSVQVGSAAHAADLSAKATGALSVMSGDVWRDLDASAATIDLHALRVHGNGVVSASGDFKAGVLTVDGNLNATAGNTFTVDTLGVGGKLDLNAAVRIDVGVASVGTDAVLKSGSVSIGTLSAGNDVLLTATQGDLTYNNLSAGRDLKAQVSGKLVGSSTGVMQARRDITVAADSFEFGSMRAGGNLSIATSQGLSGNVLAAGGALDLAAGSTVAVRDIEAGGSLQLRTNGNIDLDRLTGETLALTTPGNISINEVRLGKSLSLAANGITAGVTASGPNPVQIDATGFGGGIASKVVLKVDAPAGLEFKRLYANNASIDSTASHNAMADARIGTLLKYRTPAGAFEVSGFVPAFVPGLLAQFYQPSLRPFFQTLDGRNFLTNAYVLQLDRSAYANSASYNRDHRDSDVLGLNASALRDALLLSPFDWARQWDVVTPPTQEKKKPVRLDEDSMDAVNLGQL
ncbi:leukotoxin LktA family filamentous adhesin [Hydrogenophaga sp. PAMC20947]|uniref:leukotoxin LktA family filamentous adhesin n=1 Tax=Hydrogenophaga sp. PAMC20947 TaxID=2565558 RepID=UPI00109DAE1B|nr:leukotoxin LktA family filamentous adhesin [Hydrogenophaga sp. PAMC20947]QCB45382.1 leukotoxin LktA family filamentous adhesin [Hydrogenophaga sp. PAMC20947]